MSKHRNRGIVFLGVIGMLLSPPGAGAAQLTITDANDPPTSVSLSSDIVDEGQPAGTTVGTLSTTDSNTNDVFTYSLVDDSAYPDNRLFGIAGSQLQTAAVLDFSRRNSYSIRVRSTDQGGLSAEEHFLLRPPSYVLWTRSDSGQASLWKIDPATGALVSGIYLNSALGAGASWLATSYEHVSATEGYVLWTRGDTGRASLWKVNPSTGQVIKSAYLHSSAGIGAPWQATSFARVSATEGYVLWTRSDSGQASLWRIDPSGLETLSELPALASAYLSGSGLGARWQATSFVRMSATEAYVLWTQRRTGKAVLWKIDPSGLGSLSVLPRVASVYLSSISDVSAQWQAMSYSQVNATEGYVLWTHTGAGMASLWKIDPSGIGTSLTPVVYDSIYLNSGSSLGRPWAASSYVHKSTPLTHTLSVGSSDPDSGAWVTLVPADIFTGTNGITPFQRTYAEGVSVTLAAPAPSGGTVFKSWSGCDSTQAETCAVVMNGSRSVTAHYAAMPRYSLTVSSANPGSGVQISVSPDDVDAEAGGVTPFTRTHLDGMVVALTAPSSAGANAFASWSGCDAALAESCWVTMNGPRSVTANFATPVPTYALAVASSNPVSGVAVMVSAVDLNAQTDGATPFQRTYTSGTVVTLTAPTSAGTNVFGSWSGCDSSDARTCTVTMNGPRSVTASFVTPVPTYALAVESVDPGFGVWVSVSAVDLNAESDGTTPFQRAYNGGTAVTLTVQPFVGDSVFEAWSGCDVSSGTTCVLTMNGPRAVTVSFAAGIGSCEGCHGQPPHVGLDGIPGSGDDAPNVMGNGWNPAGVGSTPKPFDDGDWGYNVNGHGANGTAPSTPKQQIDPGPPPVYSPYLTPNASCTDCHDISLPASGDGQHFNGILNSVEQKLNPSENTAHLRTDGPYPFIVATVTNDYDVQVAFDRACWMRCHQPISGFANMRHVSDTSASWNNINVVPNVVRFGDKATEPDGESIPYPIDSALTTLASVEEDDYAPCISCHNPHGTSVVEPWRATNRMIRDRWVEAPNSLCHTCHQ